MYCKHSVIKYSKPVKNIAICGYTVLTLKSNQNKKKSEKTLKTFKIRNKQVLKNL